ncbi:T9SS type B sorting domain-containing protein [uncultured Algibacter sp.]|uniref:T9SS type B sorting domain-containing protein n=1 Tax=uncultured Algibacter sp. TaxID=298659 RepID=UPI0026286F93|nr:T9SS type B sorting domain-containing protein [uncultured Algibacter sp.]
MPTNRLLQSFLFALIILLSFKGFSQLSKTHYIPPLTFANSGSSSPQDQYIYLSTPRTSDVPYTIKPIGQPEVNYITGVVSNNNPAEISIGSGGNTQLFIQSPASSVVTNNKGYIIESEDVIYVSVRMNAGYQAGALVSKGLSALDTTFRIGSYTNENPQDNYLNFVSVMATEDDTEINFSNLPSGIIIQNYSGSTPVNVTLDEGESYTLAINSNDTSINRDGLIGCLVNSDKPIVVNCGSANGSFGSGDARDYGIDQIVGLSKIGTEYIFVKGDGANDWENVLLVAHTNNTSININGNATGVTINTGEYFVIEGNNYSSNGNMYVETSQPVFAYQGVGGLNNGGSPSEANQGMFFVPPLSCETRGNLDNIANINNIGFKPYDGGITIVTKVTANVTVTSSITGNINLGTPNPVTGKTDYITYKIKDINGNITVTSDDELYCAYFNYSGAATSGSFYSGFPSPPEINFNAEFATLGNCIPNITLEAANAENFDSFKWLFDDGSGFMDLMITTSQITPSIPGKYKLVGIITCTGEELESIEVPVSICPDDRDNDGIIDNIDIDNDNDGILNCTESNGDVILNIQNINVPQLIFQDGYTNNTITSASYTQTSSSGGINTLNANNLGDFTSMVSPANDAESDYSLTFTESVNIKFSEDISNTHISTDGEYFIARILPVNKNITVINPDDRLLIDSNFDGIFETGVTQLSGSEIHFKINPSPTGNTPYAFYANQVDGFSFIHKLSNTGSSSTFYGNISLTCFKKDNDNDGIKDEFDLDSDNDGIPDFIENTGLLITLSGVDADFNGLDDIYDITAPPLDSDTDSIYDFYDLDSDNDGIYDLIESGEFGTLSDTNLDGIEDGPNYGTNGWADAVETAPDSNLIGYTPNDFDTDTIFSYLDLDSDGDGCSDVIEAGFSDGNTDDLLGDNVVTTNDSGVVTNATDGYIIPNPNYLDYAPITITTQPLNTLACELSMATISVVSVEAETYQWELSTDGLNWSALIEDATHSGVLTSNLTISNIPLTFNGYLYRVKLDRSDNSCGIYSDEAVLNINGLPVVNNPNIYLQCDDASNDGQAFFNLTLDNIKGDINTNYLNEGLIFTYYLTQTEAETNTNPISNPENYQDALGFTPETVWIRVENTNGCFRVVPIILQVSPSSATLSTYNPTSIYQCDDGTNDRDGISTFDITHIENYISTTLFSTFNVTVHFYESQIDAELETNEILDIANHQNINSPNTQSVWVRVKSELGNNCLGLEELSDLLIVEALPIANPVAISRECDFNTTDTFVSYPFDTSTVESTVLNGQSLTDVTITYNYLELDGSSTTTNILPNPFLTESQTITITLTNNTTQDTDGPCYDETTLEFIVDEQPVIADIVPTQVVCDGDTGDIDDDGFYPFDTSSFTSTILGTQPGMQIYYDYLDESGNLILDSLTLPNPFVSENQTITVEVINPNNRFCTATTEINLVVNPLPVFYLEEEIIVCDSPFIPFDLVPSQANNTEVFYYQWTYEDGSILGNTLILENITQPGKYTITLTNPITLCDRSLTIDVKVADIANITLKDVDIDDLSENNTVTIIDPSSLGNSTYLFSLISDTGLITFPYQENPVFNNVPAGFYTLFVQDDKAICDPVELIIPVIGHPKFFTPNGDGHNDFWQIKGINSNNQSNSIVSIYDRYGKLLKQIRPSEKGWDGTFNGSIMSTDDYWFRVYLEDGREFSGHFTLKR